jgi:DNA-binding NarL/FixJ family response regulator
MEHGLQRPIRVILADDHELVRSGFCALLSVASDIEVVGQARDGFTLLSLLETTNADVVVCDIAMPGMDGLEALERIGPQFPELRVLFLSSDDSAAVVKRALRKGASGYIIKRAAADELELAIRTAADGGSYLSPSITRSLLLAGSDTPEEQLTERQVEILSRIAYGGKTKAIADSLGLSPKTVHIHRSRIMERLRIRDVASLTRYALRHRLVSAA